MKGSAGTVLHDQDIATAANNAAAEQYLTPNYTVQSPYSTINVSENQCWHKSNNVVITENDKKKLNKEES